MPSRSRSKSKSKSRKGSKCPPGKILRKGYRRKGYSRKSGSYVSRATVGSACVPDKGAPGKTPKSKRILARPQSKHMLRAFGYSVHASDATRHSALQKASQLENPLSVLRHLNLIRNLQGDAFSKSVMARDIQYMSSMYKRKGLRRSSKSRKGSKKSRKGSKKSRKSRK
jgi:hypothetical protein